MLAKVSVICFLASYLVALGLEVRRSYRQSSLLRQITLLMTSAGLVAHTSYLITRSRETRLPPLLSSPHDWLLVLAWLIIVFYLLITLVEPKMALGLFLLPLVLALIAGASFVSLEANSVISGADLQKEMISIWAMVHTTLLVFGMGGVVIGLVLSLMYLFQHRRLKSKQLLSGSLALPNLEKLARLNWWSIMLSIPLLTLGMLTGLGLSWKMRQGMILPYTDPVIIGNGVVLAVMIVYFIWMARKDHPQGKQVAWMTIWACSFLLVTVVGMQIITGGGPYSIHTWH